jgi:hypothetical protein
MGTPQSPAPGREPDPARMQELIEQLQSRSWKSSGVWRAYACAVLYGVMAAIAGGQFFILYSGGLVVVFLLHDSSERRIRMQSDLLAQLVREMERKRS